MTEPEPFGHDAEAAAGRAAERAGVAVDLSTGESNMTRADFWARRRGLDTISGRAPGAISCSACGAVIGAAR